jgi:hypothetical protein
MRSPAAPPTTSPPACYEGTFPGYTDQARNVRGEVASWLALERCPAAITEDAKVVANELAANAVLHSASRGASFAVRCEIGSGNWGNEPAGNGHRIVWVRLPWEQR